MTSFLEHPLLKPESVEKRLFQLDLAASALKASTLVVVPTGLGKTVIALMVLLARIEQGRILFLAPTKPLVEQHASFLKRVLTDENLVTFMTGEVAPEKRVEAWNQARVVISTPQVIENDLLSRRIDLGKVSCIIFDEAHRAVGNYAYVYIAGRYQKECERPLVMGITASPGSQSDKIEEICSNLGIESIQTRTEDDPDVAPFVYQKEIEWVRVTVPDELVRLRSSLEDVLKDRMASLNALGIGEQMPGLIGAKIDPRASKRELLDLQARLRSYAAREPSPALFKGISIMAEVMKLQHAVELAETQGTDALTRYFERLESEANSRGGSKASRRLMDDVRIVQARELLANTGVEHPKLASVKRLLGEQLLAKPDSRIMVFTNYRDTASALLKFLENDPSIKAVRFVGQSSRQSDEGLSQKKQAEILSKFRAGEYNVLIATSVGEEGIDIPATDMVLFYEPVPSEIRSIQRKGRTGRARAGRVVVLIARGTRDEAYYWISERKEKNMQKQIRGLSAGVRFEPRVAENAVAATEARQVKITDIGAEGFESQDKSPDMGLNKAMPGPVSVFVDPRERDMGKRLEALGMEITLRNLEVGDYVVSDRIAIERKTAEDFVSSIIDPKRNLFRQVEDLARSYDKPLLILEGRDLYTRQISPNSIRGAMAAIAVDYGVPIIPTEDAEETAAVISLLARREQAEGREPKVHGQKTARTLKEQQEYVVSAMPSVGPAVARNLLKHFGSVQAVVNASDEELRKVDLVGPKIAERIKELVGGVYKG
ncbi:MAG TPA: DEAD/DEAH box helicase [Methanotrichaceae archaeon]|nr:DEAD/DEAH box helicase [Methanotrichaceae archaeon]